MSTDVKEKPNQFLQRPKIWYNQSFGRKLNVADFLNQYDEISNQRDRFSATYSLSQTKLEIINGQATMRFYDAGKWSDNFFFTKFGWSKLGMFLPRYFCGFTKDMLVKLNDADETIEELYWNICEDINFQDHKVVFRLENDVDGKNIIRSVVSEKFTELDDDILLEKMRDDKSIHGKYILNAKISDTYSNIRIGDTTPEKFELRKPVPMVEFSNADSGGKALKMRSGMFTGHCLNGLNSITGVGIKKYYHTGDVDRVSDNIGHVYDFLLNNSQQMIMKYAKAQKIQIEIADNFLVFKGKGKNRKTITHGTLKSFGNSDVACKSFIKQSTPNNVKPNGKNIKNLLNCITSWKSDRIITEEPTLARCIDVITYHAQQYDMESRVDLEDYATLLLNKNIHKDRIVIEPSPSCVLLPTT